VTLDVPAQGTASGHVFVAPFSLTGDTTRQFGGLIVDDTGEPIWFHPTPPARTVMNLRVQKFRGNPVLTWYEGRTPPAYGGVFVVGDSNYREIARVKGAHGFQGDVHEFVITSRGTALIAIYSEVAADLTAFGGPSDGRVVEGIVQELALPSGKLLFEWHSLQHVPLEESYRTAETPQGNVDYLHLNSIAVDVDGNLLVSARHTSTVYKLDRRSGRIIWRLGGKDSDFQLGSGARFDFQHDARGHADGTLTLFDNGATGTGAAAAEPFSRAIALALDTTAKTATLVAEYVPTRPRLTVAMGNLETLPDGGAFVGWGTDGSFSEIGPDGTTRLDAHFDAGIATYRAFRSAWQGRPLTTPALAVAKNTDGTSSAHASWNGATEVVSWQLRAGSSPRLQKRAATAPRAGFETAIAIPPSARYISVVAADASGRVLGTSKTIAVTS